MSARKCGVFEMRKYKVMWSKAYYASGVVEVEAEHPDDAHDKVANEMGDFEGSMQYDPDGDEVFVMDGMERA
jgi:hypothetical protein